MTIADRIRNRRLELGLSVDDLAKRLNKNRATVYRYESNYIKSYSHDVMETLAKALETTPAYLYGYDKPLRGTFFEDQLIETPLTNEARIISGGVDKMPPEKREQALKILQTVFAEYADFFKEETDNDT